MRLDFVVPRYGREVTAGAENAARMLAERLVASFGWQVSVLTTTALDLTTWAEALPAGTEELAGVRVRRFGLTAGRDPGFHDYSGPLLAAAEQATVEQAERWIRLQGPVSDDLLDAVASSDADAVAFYPYLYHPTVAGLPLVAERAVLHAAAHDEAPIRLPVFRSVFEGCAGLVFHTHWERRLVQGMFQVAGHRQIVLGLGMEAEPGDAAAAAEQIGAGERPYLLYLGRVDDQKGTGGLWRAFLTYKRRHPGPLALVLAGPVVDRPPDEVDLLVPGAVPESTKWGLLRGAQALVHPSLMESFSLVLLEAMSVGTMVVVNAGCHATMEHVRRSAAGLSYRGYAELEGVLDRITADGPLREQLGRRGLDYVSQHFAWPVVLERYGGFIEAVVGRKTLL